jgi:poly(A) polymerase
MPGKSTPEEGRRAAMAIVRVLRGAGHTAYFAGGCVRDELLGLSPTDYDVATDATPERIGSLFKRTNEVGAAFGVVLVTPTAAEGGPPASATVEVATFRSDGPYSDRRRPDAVTFSDPRTDAMRRDFTINALFLDPLAAGLEQVIDYVGGRDDLGKRVIRAVGDPESRLAEDHLRALRAVRLSARLGFTIDPPTADAIRKHASNLSGVSRERIGDEVRRMVSHPTRAAAAATLESLQLDAPVLTESHRLSKGGALAGIGEGQGYPTSLAAWACDRGLRLEADPKNLLTRWREALCLSNEESEALRAVLGALIQIERDWGMLSIAKQKRLAGQDSGFEGALEIATAREPALGASVRARVKELSRTASGLCPEPLVTGDDLIRAGMLPGPSFKRILDSVYDAQLEDRVRTSTEALELARSLRV